MKRSLRLSFAVLAVGSAPAALFAGSPRIVRDWSQYPAVIQIDHADEIFAIGDAHSDFKRLTRAMAAAGIIEKSVEHPEDARWSAGKAVLVTTGDMIDKGPRALDVLRVLRLLRTQARLAGGDIAIL